MSLTIQKRWEIVFLKKHRLGPKLDNTKIAKEIGCSRDTVRTWVERYEETGDVLDEEGNG